MRYKLERALTRHYNVRVICEDLSVEMRYKLERALTLIQRHPSIEARPDVEMRYKLERALTRHWAASSLIKE